MFKAQGFNNDFMDDKDGQVGKYRNKDGGHIFFRPVSLFPFTKVMVRIKDTTAKDFAAIIKEFPKDILWIRHKLWLKVIWDNEQKKMIMGNKKLIELLLLYVYNCSLLTETEKNKMV